MNNKGFSIIEMISSLSILMIIMLTIIPIIDHIKAEETALKQRRVIPSALHNELLQYIWIETPPLPIKKTKTIKETTVVFHYKMEDDLLKGCATWKNAKQKKETFCLYGYTQ